MPKNIWAIIIGSVIISIGIIIAGNSIANSIAYKSIDFPSAITVFSGDGPAMDTYAEDTYLSESEAANFLKLSDTDFQKLLQTHDLDTAYATIQGQRVYSKKALADYVGSKIISR